MEHNESKDTKQHGERCKRAQVRPVVAVIPSDTHASEYLYKCYYSYTRGTARPRSAHAWSPAVVGQTPGPGPTSSVGRQ